MILRIDIGSNDTYLNEHPGSGSTAMTPFLCSFTLNSDLSPCAQFKYFGFGI